MAQEPNETRSVDKTMEADQAYYLRMKARVQAKTRARRATPETVKKPMRHNIHPKHLAKSGLSMEEAQSLLNRQKDFLTAGEKFTYRLLASTPEQYRKQNKRAGKEAKWALSLWWEQLEKVGALSTIIASAKR
jgi:putative salt-induced outer membrane protein YdiY